MAPTKPTVSSVSARPFLRHKGVVALAAAATATAVAFRYKASALKHNEVEQRTRKAPYGYVSVDRSGGGI